MKEWLQKRIDYWEDVVEKENDYQAGMTSTLEKEYHKGLLQGFYEAMEYLDGQRR